MGTTLGSLCSAVDGAGMMRQLAVLAHWVKLSGTEEEGYQFAPHPGATRKSGISH